MAFVAGVLGGGALDGGAAAAGAVALLERWLFEHALPELPGVDSAAS